ncbi:MAG: SRPBCC domain-containing protein [Bacteroidota bacterium]|nr:SRPBCC domain-containing protein [Bacteroidota bacterium]
MKKEIIHQLFFPFSPQTVWEYLTKPELMEQWLMPTNFEPVVGQPFQFKTKPIQSLGFDGIFYCTVLEIVPLQKLSYSWKGGPGDGTITLDSIVVWTLTAKENGTELLLQHSGFTEVENLSIYNGMKEGWLKNMQKMENLIKNKTYGTANA